MKCILLYQDENDPIHGLCDIFSNIYRAYKYSVKFNRTLLIDFKNTTYKCNLGNFCYFKDNRIITNSDKINYITRKVKDKLNVEIYPHRLYTLNKDWSNKIILMKLTGFANKPGKFGGIERPFSQYPFLVWKFIFENLVITETLKTYINSKLNLIQQPYTAIQIRNTDRTCNYTDLFIKNSNYFDSIIYLATDNKNTIIELKEKYPQFKFINFCTFPENSQPMHFSNIDGDFKMRDLLTDLFIVAKSNKFYTNGAGRYSHLCDYFFKNNNFIKL